MQNGNDLSEGCMAGKQWGWECDPRLYDFTQTLYCLSITISATRVSATFQRWAPGI